MLYFVVDNDTQRVMNIVHWDGETDYGPSYPGATLYEAVEGYDVGHYRQSDGSYAEFSLADAKLEMREWVNWKLQEKFEEGYSPTTGPLAGHTLQCRGTEDRTNWLTSQTSYMAAVQMGYGAVPGASFRTMANQTVTITFQQGLEVLTNGMAVWGKNLMAHSWTLKDDIEAAESFEDLNIIDLDSGWPTT